MSTADPNLVILTGENPFIRLAPTDTAIIPTTAVSELRQAHSVIIHVGFSSPCPGSRRSPKLMWRHTPSTKSEEKQCLLPIQIS